MGELLHLFSYVAEEGITGPSSYHHDGEGGNYCKLHDHGVSGSDGVCVDSVGLKPRVSLPRSCATERSLDRTMDE